VKFAWIRACVKSGLLDHLLKKKEWAVMVIALFTSDFPTMQLCDHHILKHKPTPESSTDPAHQYIETGWKDQKLQRQYKIGQTYVVTMTS